MNEQDFREQLLSWSMSVRSAIVPTDAYVKLYGDKFKTRIVAPYHDYLIYENVNPLEIDDDKYKELSENRKWADDKILEYFQLQHEVYLKNLRKKIIKLQRLWSKTFCQGRATMIMDGLSYDNIYHICDLTNDRLVPIELIINHAFDVASQYGDYRKIKNNKDIYVDPRVLQVYNESKR